MKKTFTFLLFLSGFTFAHAQNTPVVEKAAPQSNNLLPSGGTLGSQSGVNPMGNPGTIANSSASNSAVNSTVAPHPNVEPGVFLSSSPEGTVTGTTVTTNRTTTQTATTVTNAGTNTAEVVEPAKAPVNNTPVTTAAVSEPAKNITIAETKTKPAVKVKPAIAKATAIAPVKEKTLPAYNPVLSNYVSEKTIAAIKTKYGNNIYDIRTVRIAETNKIAYIVRLLEDGKLRNELYYDQP